nr:type II toxin-antitoxin system RelB/DinJ family antitoxin [Acinetobacter baumannii]
MFVSARVPNELKVQAERILKEVGLNTTDAIRLLLTQ